MCNCTCLHSACKLRWLLYCIWVSNRVALHSSIFIWTLIAVSLNLAPNLCGLQVTGNFVVHRIRMWSIGKTRNACDLRAEMEWSPFNSTWVPVPRSLSGLEVRTCSTLSVVCLPPSNHRPFYQLIIRIDNSNDHSGIIILQHESKWRTHNDNAPLLWDQSMKKPRRRCLKLFEIPSRDSLYPTSWTTFSIVSSAIKPFSVMRLHLISGRPYGRPAELNVNTFAHCVIAKIWFFVDFFLHLSLSHPPAKNDSPIIWTISSSFYPCLWCGSFNLYSCTTFIKPDL